MHVTTILVAETLWLVVIGVMDLRIRKVRNWMVLLGLSMGLAFIAAGVQPFQISIWNGLGGMLVAFVVLLPFYAMRWMGAGDVKFAAVMGLWFGLSPNLLIIWIGGSLLAGVHGLLVVLWRRLQWSSAASWLQARLPLRMAAVFSVPGINNTISAVGRREIQRSIPYAGYMAIAAIWIVLSDGRPLTI